jgi:glycosyltransferase involved in cell wall biosynthesis
MMDNTDPIITVGLPTHNGARTIGKALESLLNQTESRFRIEISDNMSSDETESICRKFTKVDSRVTYTRQSSNIGPIGNFKYVLEQANTDYFMWACDDDLWDKRYFEKLIGALTTNNEYAFAITPWKVCSWRIPLIRRLNLPSMAFVSDPDPRVRVRQYAELPFSSFKDNMVFGVWRTLALKNIMNSSDGAVKYFSIGGPLNEYTLSLYMGLNLSESLFIKRYKSIPPGHILNEILSPLIKLIRRIKGSHESRTYPHYDVNDFKTDIRCLLKLSKMDEEFIDGIVKISDDAWR